MASHKSPDDEIYEAGVRAGQDADFPHQAAHALTKGWSLPGGRRANEIYNKGFDYGVEHKPRPRKSVPPQERTPVPAPPSVSDPELVGAFVACGDNPIGQLFAGVGALWGLVAGFQAWGFGGAVRCNLWDVRWTFACVCGNRHDWSGRCGDPCVLLRVDRVADWKVALLVTLRGRTQRNLFAIWRT